MRGTFPRTIVASAMMLAALTAADAATKHRRHVRDVDVIPNSLPAMRAPSGPHMVQIRPGLWISSWGCVVDEGQGRLRSCDADGRR
jgi:hypothetical protein